MNVLIVNAFGTSPKATSQFEKFCDIIDTLLRKVSFKSGKGNFFYFYRSVDQLDDFIYNLPSNEKASDEKKNEYKKNFDKLDFIFIDGKERCYLPFLTRGYKLLSLIRLCEQTGKAMFSAGVAMLHVVYLLSTGDTEKNIINSNGDYPSIEDIDKIPYDYICNLKRDDAFLDFVTGDVYEYSSLQWNPILNIGLHKLLYAEKYRNRGRYVLKEYKEYKNEGLISTNKKEIKTNVLKQYCLHWLVKEVPVAFVAYTSLTWYMHNVCVKDKEMQYKTICDSNFGPMVIEHKNTVASMFHVMKSYPVSVKLLQNFIAKKFVEVQSKTTYIKTTSKFESIEAEKLFRSVVKDISDDENDKNTSTVKTRPTSKIALVDKSRLFSNVTHHKSEGAHCGFSYNNRDMIFVDNNAVILNDIKVKKGNYSPSTSIHEMTRSVIKDDYDYLRPDPNCDDDQMIDFYKKQGREICKKLQEVKSTEDTTVHKVTRRGLSARITTKYHSGNTSSSVSSSTSRPITAMKSKKSIIMKPISVQKPETESVLTMLFPYIKEEDFQIKAYNPGKSGIKPNTEIVRVNLETKIKSNYLHKFQKYEKELNTFGDKPSIRCSSAYMTQEEARRKEFMESKKKWMCNEDFKKVFGKQTLAMRDKEELMYNSRLYEESKKNEKSEYKSVLNYAYRTTDKSKWICKKNFIV